MARRQDGLGFLFKAEPGWLRGLDLNQRSRTRDYEPLGLFAPGKLVRSKPVSRKNPCPDF